MVRYVKNLLIAAILVGCTAVGSFKSAQACGWWWSCWWTPYPCVTACDPCYDGCWYLGLRPGPIRRLLFGPYRWYYDPCCLLDCCVEVTPTVVAKPTPAPQPTPAPPEQPQPVQPAKPEAAPAGEAQPAMPEQPQPVQPVQPQPAPLQQPQPVEPAVPQPAPAAPPATDMSVTPQGAGTIVLRVPEDAVVTINGYRTKSTGSIRQYVSYGLQPGKNYRYEVVAEVVRQGRVFRQSQTVYLTAGSSAQLAMLGYGSEVTVAYQPVW